MSAVTKSDPLWGAPFGATGRSQAGSDCSSRIETGGAGGRGNRISAGVERGDGQREGRGGTPAPLEQEQEHEDAWQDLQTDRVIVNGEFSLSVVVARCVETPTGLLRWHLRFDTSLAPDITIVVRMDSANRAPFDYYLFPRIDMLSEKLRLGEENTLGLDAYRFDGLELLYDIATPIPLGEAA